MFYVQKDGHTMPVKYKVHLDAFLADGWTEVENPVEPKPEPPQGQAGDYEAPRTRPTTRRRSSLSDE